MTDDKQGAALPTDKAKTDKHPTAQPITNEPASQPCGEQGGPQGPEPTRYGDWEKNGRVSDF